MSRRANAERLCGGEPYNLTIDDVEDVVVLNAEGYSGDGGIAGFGLVGFPRYLLFVRSFYDGQLDEGCLYTSDNEEGLKDDLEQRYAAFMEQSWSWEAELFDLELGIELDFRRDIVVFPKGADRV